MRCFTMTDMRSFTAALFTKSVFDLMPVEEVHIVTASTFHMDGRTVPAFYTSEEIAEMPDGLPEYTLWEQLRPLCFSIIKGKKAPVSFRITFHAPQALVRELCDAESCTIPAEQVQSLVYTIRYADGICKVITGSSYKTFLPDQSLDHIWDDYFRLFLSGQQLAFEED